MKLGTHTEGLHEGIESITVTNEGEDWQRFTKGVRVDVVLSKALRLGMRIDMDRSLDHRCTAQEREYFKQHQARQIGHSLGRHIGDAIEASVAALLDVTPEGYSTTQRRKGY